MLRIFKGNPPSKQVLVCTREAPPPWSQVDIPAHQSSFYRTDIIEKVDFLTLFHGTIEWTSQLHTWHNPVVSGIISLMSCIKVNEPTFLLTNTNLQFFMLKNIARTQNFWMFSKLMRLVLKWLCFETTSNHSQAMGCHNFYAINKKWQICLIFLNFVFCTVMGNDYTSQVTTKSGLSG